MHYLFKVAISLLGALATVDAFTPSSGCGQTIPSSIKSGGTGSSNKITITSNGISRNFLLHVPSNFNKTANNEARGLIFSYHGRGKSASSQEVLSSFSDPYFNKDNFAVYPQGISNQWQGDPAATTDDVKFTLDMIDYLNARYCINTDAIFSTGKSNGGGFSINILACDATASTKIAAFASNSGAYYQDNNADGSCSPGSVSIPCNAARAVPIMEFHGSADTTIPFYGGERRGMCLPTVTYFLQQWGIRDGLGINNVTTNSFSNQVHKHEYGQAQGKLGFITSYWISGLTHAWASTLPNDDSSTPTFLNATSIMLDWFNEHTL